MSFCRISITDADAAASAVLRRSRLDGLDSVPLPFEEPIVQAWRRGAPRPDMDVDTLHRLLEVRDSRSKPLMLWALGARARLQRCCSLARRSRTD